MGLWLQQTLWAGALRFCQRRAPPQAEFYFTNSIFATTMSQTEPPPLHELRAPAACLFSRVVLLGRTGQRWRPGARSINAENQPHLKLYAGHRQQTGTLRGLGGEIGQSGGLYHLCAALQHLPRIRHGAVRTANTTPNAIRPVPFHGLKAAGGRFSLGAGRNPLGEHTLQGRLDNVGNI